MNNITLNAENASGERAKLAEIQTPVLQPGQRLTTLHVHPLAVGEPGNRGKKARGVTVVAVDYSLYLSKTVAPPSRESRRAIFNLRGGKPERFDSWTQEAEEAWKRRYVENPLSAGDTFPSLKALADHMGRVGPRPASMITKLSKERRRLAAEQGGGKVRPVVTMRGVSFGYTDALPEPKATRSQG